MQAQHPDLTLTGMYNGLEKLRAAERHATDRRSASMANAYSPDSPSVLQSSHSPSSPTASAVRDQKSVEGSQKPATKTPWPKTLADRIRATEQALHAAKAPVTAADLTKHFTRAKPHDIQEIVESLVTLGRARMEGERFSV